MKPASDFGRNIGPKSAALLRECGIENSAALQQIGAKAAYARLKFQFSSRVSLNFLYALEACLRACDWKALPPDIRQDLVKFHESLKSREKLLALS